MVITQESLRRELYMQQGASAHPKKSGVRNIKDIRPIGLCGCKYIEKILAKGAFMESFLFCPSLDYLERERHTII